MRHCFCIPGKYYDKRVAVSAAPTCCWCGVTRQLRAVRRGGHGPLSKVMDDPSECPVRTEERRKTFQATREAED